MVTVRRPLIIEEPEIDRVTTASQPPDQNVNVSQPRIPDPFPENMIRAASDTPIVLPRKS